MFARNIVTAQDLAALLEIVFDYNQRGKVERVLFFDEKSNPLAVAYCEVVTDGPGLLVDLKPRDSRAMADVLNPPVDDPRKVPAPLTTSQLDGVTNP